MSTGSRQQAAPDSWDTKHQAYFRPPSRAVGEDPWASQPPLDLGWVNDRKGRAASTNPLVPSLSPEPEDERAAGGSTAVWAEQIGRLVAYYAEHDQQSKGPVEVAAILAKRAKAERTPLPGPAFDELATKVSASNLFVWCPLPSSWFNCAVLTPLGPELGPERSMIFLDVQLAAKYGGIVPSAAPALEPEPDLEPTEPTEPPEPPEPEPALEPLAMVLVEGAASKQDDGLSAGLAGVEAFVEAGPVVLSWADFNAAAGRVAPSALREVAIEIAEVRSTTAQSPRGAPATLEGVLNRLDCSIALHPIN